MSSIMDKGPRQLAPHELAEIEVFKALGRGFWDAVDKYTPGDPLDGPRAGRELALAKTKIEEAVMWATTAVTG